jgi:hypothetical protein
MTPREVAYQERTKLWFREFWEMFHSLRVRAKEKARKLARADRKRHRWRNFDLLFMCFKSRLATAIYKRRVDWQLEDCNRWLVRCGLTPDQAQAVTDDVIRRRIRAQKAREEAGSSVVELILPPKARKQKEPGSLY